MRFSLSLCDYCSRLQRQCFVGVFTFLALLFVVRWQTAENPFSKFSCNERQSVCLEDEHSHSVSLSVSQPASPSFSLYISHTEQPTLFFNQSACLLVKHSHICRPFSQSAFFYWSHKATARRSFILFCSFQPNGAIYTVKQISRSFSQLITQTRAWQPRYQQLFSSLYSAHLIYSFILN